jgi:uncharacterized protein YndB with AHSA1/START domain
LVAKTNPVAGGSYSIVEHDSGGVIAHDGVYSTVERPKRLAFSLRVPQHFAGTAQIDVTITPEGSKSRLEFVARGAEVMSFGTFTGTPRGAQRPIAADWAMQWRVQGGRLRMTKAFVPSLGVGMNGPLAAV